MPRVWGWASWGEEDSQILLSSEYVQPITLVLMSQEFLQSQNWSQVWCFSCQEPGTGEGHPKSKDAELWRQHVS